MEQDETARRAQAIHQVDSAFGVLLVISTFTLDIYSRLVPPTEPAAFAPLTGGIYALSVAFFLLGVLRQWWLGRFFGWFFTLVMVTNAMVFSWVPRELLAMLSPQRVLAGMLTSWVPSYLIVTWIVAEAYIARVRQVSLPEDYLHSVSSFACQEELKREVRSWRLRWGPGMLLLLIVLYLILGLPAWLSSL